MKIRPAVCVVEFKKRLGSMGYEVEVLPSPRRLSLVAVNDKVRPRFKLEFSPGSSVEVRDADAQERAALVSLVDPAGDFGSGFYILGTDDAALFSRQCYGLGGLFYGDLAHGPTTLAEAFEMITPEPVRQSRREGVKVLRQGDIWFVPLALDGEADIEGTRHRAERLERAHAPLVMGWIRHPEHKPLFLDRPHWAYRSGIGD
jgi:hypothetical protein